jgi:hypothetical protein
MMAKRGPADCDLSDKGGQLHLTDQMFKPEFTAHNPARDFPGKFYAPGGD